MGRQRKTRKLRGGAESNANVERAAKSAREKIKTTEAKAQVLNRAEAAAYKRYDYGRLISAKDKLILTIKRANDDIKDIDKKKARMINEEFVKQAADWEKTSMQKRGWFSW